MSLMLLCVLHLVYDSLWLLSLLYFLIFTHSENSIYLSLTVQKFKNAVPRLRGTHFGIPNVVKCYLFLTLANAENFMCLASVVKKFEFWRPRFGGNPHFSTPKLWSNFVLFLYLLTSNTSCFQLKKLKNFSFGGLCLGATRLFLNPHFLFGLVYF